MVSDRPDLGTADVYAALAEAELQPDWVAGVSIGAINGALIAHHGKRRAPARFPPLRSRANIIGMAASSPTRRLWSGFDLALTGEAAEHQGRAEGHRAGRQFRCRVGVGGAATQRAAVADRDMADMRRRLAQQRKVLADKIRGEQRM